MSDFEVTAGDSKTIELTIMDGNVPMNLTGCTIQWGLGKTPHEATDILKSTASGIDIINAVTGRCNVRLDPIDTKDLKGEYYYETKVTLAGVVSTVRTGPCTILPALIRN